MTLKVKEVEVVPLGKLENNKLNKMEIKSPIFYKRLDASIWSENEEEKRNKKLFVDQYSKKLIQFNEENIKIFNKDASKLIKKISIKLTM